MAEISKSGFRAVIVGGGPVGLCLAHAFGRVGIDYVLLERRDTVVEPSGFGLALWPHGVRILDQLGLLEEGREIWLPMRDKYNIWPDGSEIGHNNLYEEIELNHGHPWMLFQRQKLLDLLYKWLHEKESRVLTKKKVVSIDTQPKGVEVHCDDGSIVQGSIVVGCDGVYSGVRGIMRDLRLKSRANPSDSETPMVAEYQLLAGHLPRIQHMQPGRTWEVRDNKISFQIFMLEREGWFLAYKRRPYPVRQYTKYTDDDAKAFAEDLMDHPVDRDMKFRDLWVVRNWTRLLDVEEGFVQHWHEDRIVLLGDAVHKMAPNVGLSLNQGWQGVVALTNALNSLLSTNPAPDTEALTNVSAAYRAKTEKMANDSFSLSKMYARITSWHNLAYKLLDRAGPYLGGDIAMFKRLSSPIIKRGLILDSIPEPNHKVGCIQWDNKPYKEDKKEGEQTISS